MHLKNWCLLIFLPLVIVATSCGEDDDDNKDDFDRSLMLKNIGENVILPEYNQLGDDITQLKNSFSTFESAVNFTNLQEVRNKFVIAYRQWQRCSVYNFGPAMDNSIKVYMNTFPTDTAQIKTNIQNADYNLETSDKLTSTGFPALDYLLYNDSDVEILNAFSTGQNASERLNYVQAIINQMESNTNYVISGWNNSYLEQFKTATGKDVGSSTGLLVNEINKDFELIKNAEVGIPLGKQTLDITRPTYVQAYYSGYAEELLISHVDGLYNLFNGIGNGNNGVGFDDYLIALDAKDGNGNDLAGSINSQFDEIKSLAGAIQNTYDVAVDQENSAMNSLYTSIQKSVVYLKTDLPSSIGVSITYQDNDGD